MLTDFQYSLIIDSSVMTNEIIIKDPITPQMLHYLVNVSIQETSGKCLI